MKQQDSTVNTVSEGEDSETTAVPQAAVQGASQPVDNSSQGQEDAPQGRPTKPARQTLASKRAEKRVENKRKHAAVRAAVLAAGHLRSGMPPTSEQLAIADPETLAKELRTALNLPLEIEPYVPGTSQSSQPVRGRPTTYTDQEGEIICQWVSNGHSLQRYSKLTGRQLGTIYRWMGMRPDFRAMCARAFEDRADTLADEMCDIADGAPETLEGVAKAKLQIETRRWCAERMRPTKWALQQSIGPTQPITFNIGISREQPAEQVTVVQPLRITTGEG